MNKLDEHFTLSLKDDGSFDFHHTKEGREKTYTPLAKGRIDLTRLREEAEKWMQNMLNISRNPIELTDQSLQNLILLIPKTPESLVEFYKKYYPTVRRKQVYPDSKTQKVMAKNLQHYFLVGYADEVAGEEFAFALLFNPEDESMNILLNNNGKCWIMDFTTLLSILPNSFEIESRYCYRCGTEVPLTSGWCPTCKKRIRKMQTNKEKKE